MRRSDPLLVFPEGNIPEAIAVDRNVRELGDSCRAFEAALMLFDHLLENEEPTYPIEYQPPPEYWVRKYRWPFIPPMAAAVALYNFRTSLSALSANLRLMPQTMEAINLKPEDPNIEMFDQQFPAARAARHAATKPRGENVKEFERHAIRVGDTQALITNSMTGRVITSSWGGEEFRFELSQESLKRLCGLRDGYWALFSPIDHSL